MVEERRVSRGAGFLTIPSQILLCSLIWAPAFLLLKQIGEQVSPLALTALRGIIGGFFLALWLLARRQSLLPRGREWRDWIVLGLLQAVIPITLTGYALSQITTALAAVLQSATPLVVALLAQALFADERITRPRALGLLLGFGGMLILLGPSALAGHAGSLTGILAMLGTVTSYAVGDVYVRAIPQADAARLGYGQLLFSGLPVLAYLLLSGGPATLSAVPANLPALLALGLFATAIPLVLYMHILRTAGPTLGSLVGYLIPFWAILIGAVLLDEQLTLFEYLGGLVMLTGVAIATLGRLRPKQAT